MTVTPQQLSTPLEEPIRIVSDLHFGHPASIIEQPSQLIPLLRDAKTVIFNGDTVELRYLKGRRLGMRNARLMRETCAEAGVRPIFINGNHDPILSELCHVDLVDGAVLVTHGDLLFHDISPWSHESEIIAEAHSRELANLDEDSFLDFEKRLKASKRAALSIELRKSQARRDNLSAIRTVLRECWPPWRPLQVFHSWAVTPAKAEALARVFRPRARFILIGHTHFSGCWRRGPRTIINTGSFLPLSGRMTVDIVGEKLTVRSIVQERGMFKAGPPLMEFAATKLLAGEGY
jgi:UDP-2,3-diacylglucosamine pyrophosphatase LpxH